MEVGNSSLHCTAHARIRMKQRCIDAAALEALLDFGRTEHQRGSSIVYLDKRARRRLRRELGDDVVKTIGKRLSTYAVISPDGAVVTVGHRFRRIRRYS